MAVIQKKALLECLETWLGLPFYEEHYKCKEHPKKYNVIYCAICKEDPVCELCWKKCKSQHEQGHHIILQVMICSRRAAIKKDEISKYLDVSNIKKYSINSKDVVYLNPYEEGISNPHCHPNGVMDKDFQFCSIACKNMSRKFNLSMENIIDVAENQQEPIMTTGKECCSHGRRRKWSPQRIPLK